MHSSRFWCPDSAIRNVGNPVHSTDSCNSFLLPQQHVFNGRELPLCKFKLFNLRNTSFHPETLNLTAVTAENPRGLIFFPLLPLELLLGFGTDLRSGCKDETESAKSEVKPPNHVAIVQTLQKRGSIMSSHAVPLLHLSSSFVLTKIHIFKAYLQLKTPS